MSTAFEFISGPPSMDGDTVMSKIQVLNSLLRLDDLLRNLPPSLPLPEPGYSYYEKLNSFHPLPSDWVQDIGVVGTVNRQLEIAFGTRAFGFTIKERGPTLIAVVPILRHYLSAFPGDIILQKWLFDLLKAASDIHELSNKAMPLNSPTIDLTNDTSDDDEIPTPSVLLKQILGQKRRRSTTPPQENDERPVEEAAVDAKRESGKKRRKAHKKRKGGLPPQDNIGTTPTEVDPRFDDIAETDSDPSKGGAPANLLVRELTIPCHPVGSLPSTKVIYRCVASSICRTTLSARHVERVYKHAVRCDALGRWKSGLHQRAEVALAEYCAKKTTKSTAAVNVVSSASSSPVPSTTSPYASSSPTRSDPFALFREQGALDFKSRASLAIVQLVCAAGIPPRILDLPEWRSLVDLLVSQRSSVRYRSPSSTALRDTLIPARAAKVTIDMRNLLHNQRNITVSFDGLTKGTQSIYTVHVITPDRIIFLYKGDAFHGSHNAAYVETLLKEVVTEIGIARIAAVVSDDTNTTKKARRDFTIANPSIINLADPIHKFQLVIKDICVDEEWKPMFKHVREILNFFGHSSHASIRLRECRQDLSISTGLLSIGNTRFASAFLSANSVLKNLPAIYLARHKNLFSSIPESLEDIFDEGSLPGMQFKMALIRFTKVIEPIYRALVCLESTNSTIGDVFAYWLAMLAGMDQHFSSAQCDLSSNKVMRFRSLINARYVEAIDEAPTDVYILGFLLHPGFRDADVYRHMNALSSTLVICIPAQTPISPVKRIPDTIYKWVRQSGRVVLCHLLKIAETNPSDELYGYDAQNAKMEFDAQLCEYVQGNYPFHRPLDQDEGILAYWMSLKLVKSAFILVVVASKINAILPNSMCDERTGSRISFLNSPLRSRTDVKTMIEQIKVKQWYSMENTRHKHNERHQGLMNPSGDASGGH